MTNKTWLEELQQVVYNQEMKPEYRVLFQHRLEQLIMDIRKHDEDELSKLLVNEFFYNVNTFKLKKLIKEYYEN